MQKVNVNGQVFIAVASVVTHGFFADVEEMVGRMCSIMQVTAYDV
jgi:hypothetical protein